MIRNIEQEILEIVADNQDDNLACTEKLLSFIGKLDISNNLLEFHKAFKQVANEEPTQIDNETLELRLALIQEELDELKEAYYKADLIAQLDAYVDLIYVLFGSIVASGMQKIVIEAFLEVHRNNMSKLLEQDEAIEFSMNNENTELYVEESGIKDMYVIKKSNGKVTKPKSYKPVDLSKFIC